MPDEKNIGDALFKVNDGSVKRQKFNKSSKVNALENSKNRMRKICNSLSIPTTIYDPKKTLNSIKGYIKDDNKVERVLYSEISGYLFSVNEEKRGIFNTNIDCLLHFVMNDDNFNAEDLTFSFEDITNCKHIVLKIYDHTNLVSSQVDKSIDLATKIVEPISDDLNYQIELVKNIAEDSKSHIIQTKEEVEKQLKSVEKEYVAILGIFAAIVFAFTGIFTFSSSVLENIHQGSMYRIVFIVLLIGFVFFNIICILFSWINKIIGHGNNKNEDSTLKNKIKDIKSNNVFVIMINIILIISMFAVICCWNNGFIEHRNDRIKEQENTIENNIEIVSHEQ